MPTQSPASLPAAAVPLLGNAAPQEHCPGSQGEGPASHTAPSPPQTRHVPSRPRPGQRGGAGAEVFLGAALQHLLFYNSTTCLAAPVGIARLSQGQPVATGTERAN